MKKIPGILMMVFYCLMVSQSAFAQEDTEELKSKTIQKEVKVTVDEEGSAPKYTVETTTTENGKTKVEKKTYNSMEEMKADSSIDIIKSGDKDGNITMKLGDKDSGVLVFTSKDGETIDIQIDEISEDMEWVHADEDDGHKIIKSSGSKMMIFKSEGEESDHSFSFITEDGDSSHTVKRMEVKVIKEGEDGDEILHEHKNVFVIKDDEGNISMRHDDDHDILVWVDEDGHKTIKKKYHMKKHKASFSTASIESLTSDDTDFSSFNLSGMPALVLKSLNYYPNPNEGEFTLTFTSSKKPVIVRILDMKGNLKMEENMEDFNGTFNKVLNVKSFDKGSYLLQVFQQDKVLNRKLVLE
jgi:hypothetical protein